MDIADRLRCCDLVIGNAVMTRDLYADAAAEIEGLRSELSLVKKTLYKAEKRVKAFIAATV